MFRLRHIVIVPKLWGKVENSILLVFRKIYKNKNAYSKVTFMCTFYDYDW